MQRSEKELEAWYMPKSWGKQKVGLLFGGVDADVDGRSDSVSW